MLFATWARVSCGETLARTLHPPCRTVLLSTRALSLAEAGVFWSVLGFFSHSQRVWFINCCGDKFLFPMIQCTNCTLLLVINIKIRCWLNKAVCENECINIAAILVQGSALLKWMNINGAMMDTEFHHHETANLRSNFYLGLLEMSYMYLWQNTKL